MKAPFVAPPKFKDFMKEVEEEINSQNLNGMSEEDKRDCIHDLAMQRAVYWSCKTAAASHNLSIILACFLILTTGARIWELFSTMVKHFLGV